MRVRSWVAMALVWAAIAGCSDDGSSQSSAKKLTAKTNVVFIVLDTVRADHVSVFGDRAATPNLEALAKTGVSFTRAYAHASMTGPSHASMFTSLLPRDHGVRKNGQVLKSEHTTLADVLGKTRRTAAILGLGALRRKFGFNQGFDTYADEFEVGWWKQADEVNAQVLPWLREHADDPFFLWVHYSDAHEPYAPPVGELPEVRVEWKGKVLTTFKADGSPTVLDLDLPEGRHELRFVRVNAADTRHAIRLNNFAGKGGAEPHGAPYPTIRKGQIDLTLPVEINDDDSPWLQFRPHIHHPTATGKRLGYAGEVEYLDSELGELFAELDKLGIRDRTLVVVTSDHGEELGEYSRYFGHVHNLYEQLIHVPLIMSFPGRLPAGKRVTDPVRHIDIMPTMLDLLGEDGPDNMRGKSLVPLAKIGASRPVIAQTHHQKKRAILYRGYKYVVSEDGKIEKLYLLPDEKRNVIATHEDTAGDAKAFLEAVLAGKGVTEQEPENADLTKEEIKALEALGYTQ